MTSERAIGLNRTHLTKHNARIDHSYICNNIGRLLETSNFVFHGILKVKHYNNLKRPIVHNATFEQREITLRIALHGIVLTLVVLKKLLYITVGQLSLIKFVFTPAH